MSFMLQQNKKQFIKDTFSSGNQKAIYYLAKLLLVLFYVTFSI